MAHPPLIGITTNDRSEHYFRLREEYVDSVRRAGGIPVMLPPGEPHPAALAARLDGIIFSGGTDINPARYGGAADHPTLSTIETARDELELALVEILRNTPQPALYICRGFQVLNVALGGSLIEHLPDEVDGSVLHKSEPFDPTSHAVSVAPDSRLAEILGRTEMITASWHHQALRKLAPGLRVVSTAPDGTIEAVESVARPNWVAVQWHPELTAATDSVQQRLFDWLVARAADYRRTVKG